MRVNVRKILIKIHKEIRNEMKRVMFFVKLREIF